MERQAITIQVDAKAARVYEAATPDERRKLDALLGLELKEASRDSRPLEEVMTEISCTAQERGLTPEILAEILHER